MQDSDGSAYLSVITNPKVHPAYRTANLSLPNFQPIQ